VIAARERHVKLQEAVVGVGKHALGCPWLPLDDQMWLPMKRTQPDPNRVTIYLPSGPYSNLGFTFKADTFLGLQEKRGTLTVSKIHSNAEWFEAELGGPEGVASWIGAEVVHVKCKPHQDGSRRRPFHDAEAALRANVVTKSMRRIAEEDHGMITSYETVREATEWLDYTAHIQQQRLLTLRRITPKEKESRKRSVKFKSFANNLYFDLKLWCVHALSYRVTQTLGQLAAPAPSARPIAQNPMSPLAH
jgi:hypothetical protein